MARMTETPGCVAFRKGRGLSVIGIRNNSLDALKPAIKSSPTTNPYFMAQTSLFSRRHARALWRPWREQPICCTSSPRSSAIMMAIASSSPERRILHRPTSNSTRRSASNNVLPITGYSLVRYWLRRHSHERVGIQHGYVAREHLHRSAPTAAVLFADLSGFWIRLAHEPAPDPGEQANELRPCRTARHSGPSPLRALWPTCRCW